MIELCNAMRNPILSKGYRAPPRAATESLTAASAYVFVRLAMALGGIACMNVTG